MLLKKVIMLCHEAKIPLMLWGVHGIGKSSAVAQVCMDNKLGHINLRCAQMEAVDLRGRPKDTENTTTYLRPEEIPIGGLEWDEAVKMAKDDYRTWVKLQPQLNSGILFLDEINRAQDDVLQAVFELVLDRKIGLNTLPPGWSIVAAGNFFEGYIVNGFNDPAFLDRFCHHVVDPSVEDWANYIIGQYGPDATRVVEFCSTNQDALNTKVKADIGFTRTPSRRSWEMVIKVLQIPDVDQETLFSVISGLVGPSMATAFIKYNNPVKPQDLLTRGVKAMEPQLKKLNRTQLMGLTWTLVPHVNTKKEKDVETMLDFVEWTINNTSEKDLVIGMLVRIVKKEGDLHCAKRAGIANKKVGMILAEVEKKLGRNNTLMQMIQARPNLSDLLSKVVWMAE